MPGETSLPKLLSSLKLTIQQPQFVFLTITSGAPRNIPLDQIQMSFRESEGLTLILEQTVAEKYGFASSQYTSIWKMITCDIHSSLEAVGFMATISRSLADAGISCNPVSGYFHDHLFVPEEKAEEAVKVLEAMVQRAKETQQES